MFTRAGGSTLLDIKWLAQLLAWCHPLLALAFCVLGRPPGWPAQQWSAAPSGWWAIDKITLHCPTRPAADLHTIGGLSTLLELLESEHSSLRWRAAEVVATCVQNNPPVQKVGGWVGGEDGWVGAPGHGWEGGVEW